VILNGSLYKASGFFVFAYLLLMAIPGEFYFNIAGVRLELYRIFLLLVSFMFLKSIMNFKRYKLPEVLLICYCFYSLLSFLVNHGAGGIQSGIILFLEIFLGYLIGLTVNGSIKRFKKLLLFVAVFYLLMAPLAIIESQTGYRATHVFFADLLGNPVESYLGDSYFRHGLHRASTVFSHPILYSVCAVMFLPIFFTIYPKAKAFLLTLGIYVAMICSVTSVGFLMVILQIGLIVMKIISRFYKKIFKHVVILSVVAFVFLSFASNRGPVLLFVQTMSLNPHTAYSRYLQWVYSFDDITANPFFGIGFSEWSRPFWMQSSIDSFWLMTALQNGIPAFILLFLFFVVSSKRYWSSWIKTKNNLFFAIFVSAFATVFAAFTVDYFDRAQLMVFMLFGVFNSFLYKREVNVSQ